MRITVTAPRSELGLIVTERNTGGDDADAVGRVVINVALQAPNSLLHDGQAWKRYPPARLLQETTAGIKAARQAAFLVHASYLFVGADEAGLEPGATLRPIIDATLEAERTVLDGPTPACVVRLGYLYGPASRSLRAYRRAFRLGRPYWAGPKSVRQRFLHSHDAADALLAAAAQRPVGRVLAAADNQPVSFATFMDDFARLVGNPLPLHLPAISAPLSRIIIAKEHMQACELRTSGIDAHRRPKSFAPRYASYRSGLRGIIDTWSSE
ncbi:MAG: hypothetical protein JOZ46_08920 [Candidatus Dormibacteraeota bacterium]|nr:hypothetical protein [Candidatus Dormibacteraeota bacterium]MBV9525919.1 hypothetical protein [Candidatus Dormibacteraeota bacterium]